jgi:cellulose synthase (UDP-forming)
MQDATKVPYLVNILSGKERLKLDLMILVWAIIVTYFLYWWFQPSHFTDWPRFSLNTFTVSWTVVLPGYYFYFLRKMKKPNPVLEIPSSWRIAMVVTRAPSEPFYLVKQMIQAMQAQDIPHDNWLADEDPTPEIENWCEENNVFLSTRKGIKAYHRSEWPRRTRCKEGNLAYFYDHYGYDRYDFVAQMDADHIPEPGYLKSMMQPFLDPKVGYVSAPSICGANAETSWVARGRLFAECTLHGTIQASYNNGWTPMCIGSHYAVRTKALKEIGGLGPELAEDHSTTLMFASKGWQGVHSIDAIANGDGPASFADGATQEFQWARSLAMIFIQETPKHLKSLSFKLKFQFLFAQLWYLLFSGCMLLSYLIPLLCLVIGSPFANVPILALMIWMQVPTAIAVSIVYWLKSHKLLRPVDSKIVCWEVFLFQLVRWPWVIYAILDAIRLSVFRTHLNWKVTPKVRDTGGIHQRFLAPYFLLIATSLLVLIGCAIHHPPTQLIGCVWLALINCVSYSVVVIAVVQLHEKENNDYQSNSRNVTINIPINNCIGNGRA